MWELRHNLGACDAACIASPRRSAASMVPGDVKLKNAPGHHATVIVIR